MEGLPVSGDNNTRRLAQPFPDELTPALLAEIAEVEQRLKSDSG